VFVGLMGACQADLDTARTPDPFSSFGAAIYREGCQRVAYTGQLAQRDAMPSARVDVSGSLSHAVCVDGEAPPSGAPPKLVAIFGQRPAMIDMVDATLPQPFLATLETFLERILPLYDDATVEHAIAGISGVLDIMAADPEVAPALARLGHRHGYRPAAVGPGLMHALVEYPDLDGFVGSFLGLIGPGGAAEAEWHDLLAAAAIALGTATPAADPAAAERTLKLAVDLLLTQHLDEPALLQGTPLPVVERDARGVALVEVDDSGVVVPPFVAIDAEHPGIARVDENDGRFVDASGVPLAVATPFPEPSVADNAPRDAQGRALTGPGETTLLYKYRDLDGTLLAGAVREAPVLLDPAKDTTLGLAWGAQALLGPRIMQTRSYTGPGGALASITYKGFDTTQSPALDLLHAFVQVAGAPNTDSVLRSAATLLDKFESQTSRAVAAMLDTSDRGKMHTEAQIPATSTLFDDLMPLVARTLRVPGLAQDLIAALKEPQVQGLAPMIARLMVAKNQLDFDHADVTDDGPNFSRGYDLTANLDAIEPVDRTQPDADFNRSLMQRIAHLVHDSNGAALCSKAGAKITIPANRTYAQPCQLFKIGDPTGQTKSGGLAMFYALSMASASVVRPPNPANPTEDPVRFQTTYSKSSFREQIVDSQVKAFASDGPLQGLVKITGFTAYPTPRALNRALFLNTDPQNPDPGASDFLRNTMEPIICKDGDRFIDVHGKSIFAWELPIPNNPSGSQTDTFYDAVRPVVDAFAKHDECTAYDVNQKCILDDQSHNAVQIFVDLLSVLHEHWASPQSSYAGHTYQSTDRAQPRFAFPDNVVSFEPLIAEVLRDGDLVPSVIGLAPTLSTFTVNGQEGGPPALPFLVDAMRYVFDPAVAPAGLAYRNGATSAVQSDGHTPVPRATPFYLLADAFASKRATLAALATTTEGARQANQWKAAASVLIDEVLTVDHVGDVCQFRNRKIQAITQLLIRFLRDRVQAHNTAGDFDAWVHHDLTSDITDKLTSPVVAALGDLAARLEHDDPARAQFYGLLNYLLDESRHDQTFQIMLTTAADQMQQFLDDRNLVPVAHALGAAMAPTRGIVDAEIALVKRSHDLDTDRALLTILRNLFQPGADGVHPASRLADIVSELNRTSPGHGGDLDAADEHSLLGELSGFLTDNQRGFMRFVGIVQNRSAK